MRSTNNKQRINKEGGISFLGDEFGFWVFPGHPGTWELAHFRERYTGTWQLLVGLEIVHGNRGLKNR